MRTRPTRGVTLMEILIVCSIMAVLMGISIGIISKLNRVVGLKAEAARIDAVLRAARNQASTDETEAVVRIDPDRNHITALIFKTVGLWHFEDDKTTGFGSEATVQGAELSESTADGKFGRCFIFEDKDTINCGPLVLDELRFGLTFEAWVFPYDSGIHVIAQRGKGFKCGLDDRYFYARLKTDGGTLEASSEERKLPVPAGRWSHVKMDFNGRKLKVYVNHALGGVYPREKPEPKGKKGKKGKKNKVVEPETDYLLTHEKDSDLILGGDRGRFRGRMDEVRVGGITREETQELAESVQINVKETSTLEIHFDPSGRLDPAFHDKAVTIVLQNRTEKGKRETIRVSIMGVVE